MSISPAPTPKPSIYDQAIQQYPILKSLGLAYKNTPRTDTPNLLEFWQPGDQGDKTAPRPAEIPLDKPGVEVYSDRVTPSDIMADATSHYLVNTDPTVKRAYEDFSASFTPEQHKVLTGQYEWAVKNEGETRPYEEWAKKTGMPAYFRGYAFKQWPPQFTDKHYTPEQRQRLDAMMGYLQGAKTPDVATIANQAEAAKKAATLMRQKQP